MSIFPSNFSILFVITEVVLSLFEFVCGPLDLGFSELEVSLIMGLYGDISGLKVAPYTFSMDRNLLSIVVVSKRV